MFLSIGEDDKLYGFFTAWLSRVCLDFQCDDQFRGCYRPLQQQRRGLHDFLKSALGLRHRKVWAGVQRDRMGCSQHNAAAQRIVVQGDFR